MNASLEKNAADEEAARNYLEQQRLSREKQQFDKIVKEKVEKEVSDQQDDIYRNVVQRTAEQWYSPAFLAAYSIAVTLFFLIDNFPVILTGGKFFSRAVMVIQGIWQVAWPAVMKWDSGILVVTIIVFVIGAAALFWLIFGAIRLSKYFSSNYEPEEKKRGFLAFLGLVECSCIAALMICRNPDVEISWISLWIIFSLCSTIAFNLIRAKTRR